MQGVHIVLVVMAQLFEKVELASEGELTKIQALLEQALERRLQVRAAAVAWLVTGGESVGAAASTS